MNGNSLLTEHRDGVLTVTINRPERRNALSVELTNRLHDLWEEVDADDAVRVVVLTSADCGTFCAGMDLKEAAEIRQRDGRDVLTLLKDPFHRRMRQVRKPIVAAMSGHFAAGGMMLALNADIRVGLAGTRGGVTESKMGRGSPWGIPLLWMLPQPIFMEMVLGGEMFPIERLHALGLVNYVESTPDAVLERARALAENISSNAPLSVQAGKASILNAMSVGCAQGLEDADRIYQPVYASEDAREGPRAFAEKRAPVWSGR
jgi:enoyl-CoA hydratase/carnithine racemase